MGGRACEVYRPPELLNGGVMKSYRIKLNFILREFEDGGFQLDDNFCHLQNLNAVEFDRLASHSS
jgi:hypothetical protein